MRLASGSRGSSRPTAAWLPSRRWRHWWHKQQSFWRPRRKMTPVSSGDGQCVFASTPNACAIGCTARMTARQCVCLPHLQLVDGLAVHPPSLLQGTWDAASGSAPPQAPTATCLSETSTACAEREWAGGKRHPCPCWLLWRPSRQQQQLQRLLESRQQRGAPGAAK